MLRVRDRAGGIGRRPTPGALANIMAMDHDAAEQMHPPARGHDRCRPAASPPAGACWNSPRSTSPAYRWRWSGKTPAIIATQRRPGRSHRRHRRIQDHALRQLHGGRTGLCAPVPARRGVAAPAHRMAARLVTAAPTPAAWAPGQRPPPARASTRWCNGAIADGARLECGGVLPDGPGFFYPAPHCLKRHAPDSEIVQQETFGPVLCVALRRFRRRARHASDHQYGLASVLYSNDYREVMLAGQRDRSRRAVHQPHPGRPYQGYHAGWKRSGLGGDDAQARHAESTQTRFGGDALLSSSILCGTDRATRSGRALSPTFCLMSGCLALSRKVDTFNLQVQAVGAPQH